MSLINLNGVPWEPIPGQGSYEIKVNVSLPTDRVDPIGHGERGTGIVKIFRIMN